MLRLLTPFIVAALLVGPAQAETDWNRYTGFAATRCEDAGTIADILESLKGLSFDNGGGRTFANATQVAITSSTTVRATASTLDCRIRIEASESGRANVYNARHIVRLYPDGRWTTQFKPNY